MRKYPFFIAFATKYYIMVEIITLGTITLNHERASNIRSDLLARYPDIHSFYSTDVYNTPVNNLLHRQESRVKIYAPNKDCQFAREVFKHPLPIAYEKDFNLCLQLVDSL